MKPGVLVLLFFAAVAHAHPEIDKLVSANRAALDAAFEAAEKVSVYAIESRSVEREIWVSAAKEEASSLHRFFRPIPPKFDVRPTDSKEEVFLRTESCFCFGQLRVTISFKDKSAFSFVIFHGRRISSESMPDLGTTPLDEDALRPFFDRMMRLRKNG